MISDMFLNLREYLIAKSGNAVANKVIPLDSLNGVRELDRIDFKEKSDNLLFGYFGKVIHFGNEYSSFSTQKKCTPGKSYACGNSCITVRKNCLNPVEGQAKNYAAFLALQGHTSTSAATVVTNPVSKPAKPASKPKAKKSLPRESKEPTATQVGLGREGHAAYLHESEFQNPQNINKNDVESLAKHIKDYGGWNLTPVIVQETGEDSYEPIGNVDILEAAKIAKVPEPFAIIADNSERTRKFVENENISPKYTSQVKVKLNRDDIPKDKGWDSAPNDVEAKKKLNDRLGDFGNLMEVHSKEITNSNSPKLPQSEVNRIAKSMKSCGKNWNPVLLAPTGEDEYKVIGNHLYYEAAKKAGLSNIHCIILDNSKETSAYAKAMSTDRFF